MRCLSTVRAYSDDIPVFLRDRPRSFITHCLKRMPPAVDEISAKDTTVLDTDMYLVHSGDRQYEVDLRAPVPSCQCADWHRHFRPCKHMLALARHHGWTCLPQQYLNLPLFVLDTDIVSVPAATAMPVHDARLHSESPQHDDVEPDSVHEQEISDVDETSCVDDVVSVADDQSQSICNSVHEQEINNLDETSRGHDAVSGADDVQSQTICSPSAQETSVVVQQSKVRQALATLNSLTYHVTDSAILQTLQDTFTQQIDVCKQHLCRSGCSFPMRRRRRIGRKNLQCSRLNKILRRVRAKKNARKRLQKQKKQLGSTCRVPTVSCTSIITVYGQLSLTAIITEKICYLQTAVSLDVRLYKGS